MRIAKGEYFSTRESQNIIQRKKKGMYKRNSYRNSAGPPAALPALTRCNDLSIPPLRPSTVCPRSWHVHRLVHRRIYSQANRIRDNERGSEPRRRRRRRRHHRPIFGSEPLETQARARLLNLNLNCPRIAANSERGRAPFDDSSTFWNRKSTLLFQPG